MGFFKITKVEERLIHELKQIDTIQRVVLFNVGRLNGIIGRLEPRIDKINKDVDKYMRQKKGK